MHHLVTGESEWMRTLSSQPVRRWRDPVRSVSAGEMSGDIPPIPTPPPGAWAWLLMVLGAAAGFLIKTFWPDMQARRARREEAELKREEQEEAFDRAERERMRDAVDKATIELKGIFQAQITEMRDRLKARDQELDAVHKHIRECNQEVANLSNLTGTQAGKIQVLEAQNASFNKTIGVMAAALEKMRQART